MKKQTQHKPRRNILSRELKGNSEAKLSHAALISEYAFEHGVNLKDRVISIVGDIDEDSRNVFDMSVNDNSIYGNYY